MSQADELRGRTKKFAIRIIHLFRALPRTTEAYVVGKQLLRCGTSVGANYRAVCRARSKAEFVARIGIVAEEADESVFWIELIRRNENPRFETASGDFERSAGASSNFFGFTENGEGLQVNYPITKLPNYQILCLTLRT